MRRSLLRGQSESVSVALLFARLGSVTPLGALTVAVLVIDPVADALIVPVAL